MAVSFIALGLYRVSNTSVDGFSLDLVDRRRGTHPSSLDSRLYLSKGNVDNLKGVLTKTQKYHEKIDMVKGARLRDPLRREIVEKLRTGPFTEVPCILCVKYK